MSYSSEIKNNLSRIKSENRCCQLAELSALLRLSGEIVYSDDQINFLIDTENPAVARLIFTLCKKSLNLHTEIIVKNKRAFNRGKTYFIKLSNAKKILRQLEIIHQDKDDFIDKISIDMFEKECCLKAYLRGVFLATGSISNPERSYHLEFVFNSERYANGFIRVLNDKYNLKSKIIMRKKNYVVYIKEGNMIVKFLNIIHAYSALLEFENVRIIKEVRNNVNRIVNCETANLSKTVKAAGKQIHDIQLIQSEVGLASLSDKLREVAILRLNNKEASLKEIGEMLDPKVTKSGVNHRFRKIKKIADKIKGEDV